MLISVCLAEQPENYSHNSESLCLSIFDQNTEQRIFNEVLRGLRIFQRARCKVVLDESVITSERNLF